MHEKENGWGRGRGGERKGKERGTEGKRSYSKLPREAPVNCEEKQGSKSLMKSGFVAGWSQILFQHDAVMVITGTRLAGR